MQLEIHDQSMTMLTMQTKNSKNAPERPTEVYTFSKSMTNPRPCWLTMLTKNEKIALERWVRRTELKRTAAEIFETNRIQDHTMDKLWENATNQGWHISQVLVFPPAFWNIGKCRDRHFQIIPSSEKSLNNLPGIGITRKMAISRFLVPIFKIASIVAWQISVTNGSYSRFLIREHSK